jgi:hypothetical protein
MSGYRRRLRCLREVPAATDQSIERETIMHGLQRQVQDAIDQPVESGPGPVSRNRGAVVL